MLYLKTILITILISLLLTIDLTISAAKYYVSTSGSDAANGLTQSTAWKTIIFAEAHAISPGDTICLKKGDIWSGVQALGIHHGGIDGKPIVWDGSLWGTGANAIIQASGNKNGSTDQSMVNIWGCKYVTFQNITVDGNNKQMYGGIIIGGYIGMCSPGNIQNDEKYITVQDCIVKNIGDGYGGSAWCTGIHIQTYNNDISNITIQRNTVDRVNNHGIAWYNSRVSNGSPGNYATKDSYCGFNTVSRAGLLENNVAAAILVTEDVRNLIVEHNTITQGNEGKSNGVGIGGGTEGFIPTNLIIRYNNINPYWSSIAIQNGLAITCQAYYNLLSGSGSPVIYIQRSDNPKYTGTSMNFYNNTIVVSSGQGYIDESNTIGACTFRNNIIVSTGTGQYENSLIGVTTTGSTIHSNNSYFRTQTGNLLYVIEQGVYIYRDGVTKWEPTAIISDPLFIDFAGFDLHLKTGSPDIKAGISIQGITHDIEGVAVSDPPSIGCYETLTASTGLVYIKSVVENSTPNILTIHYNLSLANIIPAASSYNVQVNNLSVTVNSVAILGGMVQLTLSRSIVYGDIVTVSYTKPLLNPLQTSSGEIAANINSRTVINNMIPVSFVDPLYVSSVIENVTPSLLELTYDQNLANIIPSGIAYAVRVNSIARSINSVTIAGTKVQLTLASPVVFGDLVTVAYTKPASNPLQTSSGGQAATMTVQSVTNNVLPVTPESLLFVSASVENATPSLLELTYSQIMANIVPSRSAFSVRVNSSSRTVNSVFISGVKVQLTLASPVLYGDVITVSYVKPSRNQLQTASGVQAASISTQPVANKVNPVNTVIPSIVSATIENSTPTILILTYNNILANIVPTRSAFSVRINSTLRTISNVAVSGTMVLLTLASPVLYGDIVTVSYTKPSLRSLQNTAGVQAVSVNLLEVTNKVDPVIPSYVSSVIENTNPSLLLLTFNLNLANISPAPAAFEVRVNSIPRIVNIVAISGTKVQLTLAAPVFYGDIITVAYSEPASNQLQSVSGRHAATITAQQVTNQVSSVTPSYVGSVVENSTPGILEMAYSLDLAEITPVASAFSVTVNSLNVQVNSVTITGNKVLLTLAKVIVFGDIVMVSYSKPSINPLRSTSGAEVSNSGVQPVVNNIGSVEYPPVIEINFKSNIYSGFIGELDATGTYDLNNDHLLFEWIVPDGVPISSSTSSKIQFLAPITSELDSIDFILKVTDGKTIQSMTVTIMIFPYETELKEARILSINAINNPDSYNSSNIVDGHLETKWSSMGKDQWIITKLFYPFTINYIQLAFPADQPDSYYFDIYASQNGQTWDPVLVYAASCSFSGNPQIFEFPSSTIENEYSFVKFVGHGNATNDWNYISELKIFGKPHTEDTQINIYPNPASDIINVSIEYPVTFSTGDGKISSQFIRIFNSSGKLVVEQLLDPGVNNIQIPISLESGIYVVQTILDGMIISVHKLIVVR